jgi:hypothetical protein
MQRIDVRLERGAAQHSKIREIRAVHHRAATDSAPNLSKLGHLTVYSALTGLIVVKALLPPDSRPPFGWLDHYRHLHVVHFALTY